MNYERINWENAPSTDTPLDADNLNKMDEALDTLNREVAKTRSDVQEVEETAASLGSQIAGIIRLEDGSTTGDAELINGRVGKDGTTYPIIGDAIRGQIGDLRDHVIEVSDEEPEEFYNKIWVKDDEPEIEIPTKAELDAVDAAIDELNERIDDVTGFVDIVFSEKGMITTNVETGATVDVTPTANDITDYAIVNCTPGDCFYITGNGWNNQRLWAFVDSSNKLLVKSAGNNVLTNGYIMAPVNSSKLIVNAKRANARRIIKLTNSLMCSVTGSGLNLTTETIGAVCNSDLNNLPNNKIYGCSVEDGSLNHAPITEFTGQLITFGKNNSRTNSDMQLFFAADGNTYKRLYWSGTWTAWQTIGERFITDGRATALATSLGGILAKVTGNCMFTANNNYWSDLPTATGYIFSNKRYADNWNIQTAISVGNGNEYQRITRYDGSGTVYRDWTPTYDVPNVKILALGDSICAGQRNSGKGFVGDLGLPYKNIAVSGSTISNVRTDNTPIPTQLVNETEYDPDIIIADGGINDYYYNAPLGTIPTKPVSDDTEANALDRNTVLGALEFLFYQMVKKFFRAQRFFVIIHKVNRNDQWYTGYAPTTNNSAGYTQQDLHDAIVKVCDIYNVKVIDIYKDGMINTMFSEYVSPTSYSADSSVTNNYYVDKDGLHPLALGYKEAYIPIVRKVIGIGTVK